MKPTQASTNNTDIAARIRQRSIEKWGERKAVNLIGEHPDFLTILQKLEKFARFDFPVLITGESGVGKELVARALYLLSPRQDMPYIVVNCPQFTDGDMTVSELFGHKKGSFTGAVADHQGVLETADGGVVFLDEIGDLHIRAQVMLLRALAEGEFKPLGEQQSRMVNIRIIAATNRDLKNLMLSQEFRDDLFFRLKYYSLHMPPLRERGEDWRLLLAHFLDQLNHKYGVQKHFSKAALKVLASYHWPGNIRELTGIVGVGFANSEGNTIECQDLAEALAQPPQHGNADDNHLGGLAQMFSEGASFWDAVHQPYMDRVLNRSQVKAIISAGLQKNGGSYKKLLQQFNLPATDYARFMDFLRQHRLKP